VDETAFDRSYSPDKNHRRGLFVQVAFATSRIVLLGRIKQIESIGQPGIQIGITDIIPAFRAVPILGWEH
jgi:hypothetical protein